MLELDIKGDISIGNVQLTKARVLYLAKLVYNVGNTTPEMGGTRRCPIVS